MKEKPGFKKTRLGWIPREWKLMSIDKITDRIQMPVDVQQCEEYKEIGIRSHGKGLFHKDKVTGKSLGNKRVFWIEPDCFVVNIVFAWEQAVSKTTEKEVGMIASHRFPMYKPKDGILDLDFMLYFFKTSKGKHLLELASPGGAGRNKTLGQREFANLEIPIPPINTQQKIADIISIWNKSIELTRQLIEAKEEKKSGLVQWLLTGRLRVKNFKDTWKERKFEEVFSFVSTYAFSRENLSYDDQYKIYNIHYGDIHSSFEGNFIDFEKNEIPKIIQSVNVNSPENYLQDGDLIMADVSEDYEGIGECMEVTNLNGKKALGGLHTFVIRDRKGFTVPTFRTYIFNESEVRNKLRRIATGTSVYGISKNNLSQIYISLPSIDEQLEISKILMNVDKEIELLRNKLEALKEQKEGLMQQLLTGKIRVN